MSLSKHVHIKFTVKKKKIPTRDLPLSGGAGSGSL